VVCTLTSTATYNGTWNSDGVILFAANDQGPILRVSASGGQPEPATQLDVSQKETRHSYPDFLPDGRHFLYLVNGSANWRMYAGTVDSNERRLIPGVTSEAKYSSTGYLTFLLDGALTARRFDPGRLEFTGEPVQIADQFGEGPASSLSVTGTGGLAYIP